MAHDPENPCSDGPRIGRMVHVSQLSKTGGSWLEKHVKVGKKLETLMGDAKPAKWRKATELCFGESKKRMTMSVEELDEFGEWIDEAIEANR